jgi:hypothetical protein
MSGVAQPVETGAMDERESLEGMRDDRGLSMARLTHADSHRSSLDLFLQMRISQMT